MGSRAACLAVVPSRGRPAQLGEMLEAFGATSVCSDVFICADSDDETYGEYRQMLARTLFTRGHVYIRVGPRQSLAGWTNMIAAEYAPLYEALITLGDDHRPVTRAWDRKLLDAARAMGGGWAYGDDGLQHENLPTAFLVSSPVVQAVGWMLLDGCRHMFVDAAARDLAGLLHRRAYLPDVHVKHLHYTSGLSPLDQTYIDGYASWAADEAVYRAWAGDPPGTGKGITADAGKVRAALA